MGKLLPAGDDVIRSGAVIDLISGVRSVGLPFAVPKQLDRVTESEVVKDVLHALQGSTSSSIVWRKSRQSFQLKLEVHVSHLSQSSLRLLLKPFLSAASSLRRVDRFIRRSSKYLNEISPSRKYPTLEAFANAVRMRLKYIRQAALDKELEAVQDPSSFTLLKVLESLNWVCAAAKFLHHTVQSAVPHQFSTLDPASLSAYLLSFLYDTLNTCSLSKDGEEEAYRTLLVLFVGSLWPHAQLLDTWLQEGTLVDPFGELFFYANSSATTRDTGFWQTGFLVRYEAPVFCSTPLLESGAPEEPKSLACPSFIRPVASSILSSGKSLQLLRHVQKERSLPNAQDAPQPHLFDAFCASLRKLLTRDDENPKSSKLEFTSILVRPQGAAGDSDSETTKALAPLGDDELHRAVFEDVKLGGRSTSYTSGDGCGSILLDQMVANDEMMKRLLSHSTDLPSLPVDGALPDELPILEWIQRVDLRTTPSSTVIVQECLVNFMIKQVNAVGTQLLRKLMGEWRLMEELALLRALYLMGSGDLLQQFSFVLFNKLDRAEPWDDFYELNTMLQESVRSSADAGLYSTLDSLVVKMDSRGGSVERAPIHHPIHLSGRSPVFGIDVLEELRFEYKVAWPLELIIDSEAIRRYNQVMCFLLKVKRAKQALDKGCRWTWKGDSAAHKPQLLLQMKLMHFVNTLHQYVMDQVLYSSWLELCDGMSSARSLDEVIACHDAYLISIQRQCFVAPDKLWTLISSRVKTILGLALDFYSIQRSLYAGGGGALAAGKCQVEIENVGKQFNECIAFLLRVLSFKLNVGHFPHLTELITRINFNNYYISESGHLLTPIPELQKR